MAILLGLTSGGAAITHWVAPLSLVAGPAADAGESGYEDADAIDSPAYEDGGAIAFVPGSSASASVYNHLFNEDGTAAGAGSGAAARYQGPSPCPSRAVAPLCPAPFPLFGFFG